ncbi:MAG: hypothetical protein L6V85_07105 [Clostridiales bacterium]|nr:MAG: hypothetical protein L6V85_07105 [Clostridiales bacterium]
MIFIPTARAAEIPARAAGRQSLYTRASKKQVSGYNKDTTNNRMELFAIIQGLRQLKERCDVTVVSDSAYATDPFLQGWLEGWKKRTTGAPHRKTT